MDDLNALFSQIMSDPEAMAQVRSLGATLGLGGPERNASGAPGYSPPQPQPQQPQSMPDLASLQSLLGSLRSQQAAPHPQPPPPPQQPQAASIDWSALSGLLGGLGAGAAQTQQPPPVDNLGLLTALLSAGGAQSPPAAATPHQSGGLLPGIDVATIAKLTQALAGFQQNRANIDLLLALKPRLKEERAKKIDDAIRLMQLVQFLPLIKESGLFGEMDKMLGGLSGLGGGRSGGLQGFLNGHRR